MWLVTNLFFICICSQQSNYPFAFIQNSEPVRNKNRKRWKITNCNWDELVFCMLFVFLFFKLNVSMKWCFSEFVHSVRFYLQLIFHETTKHFQGKSIKFNRSAAQFAYFSTQSSRKREKKHFFPFFTKFRTIILARKPRDLIQLHAIVK